jgi:Beta propeller domain
MAYLLVTESSHVVLVSQVTYEQIDPFYTIDLKDPTKPVKAGELEIPGYSSYLHPIGANLILGVGQVVVNDRQGGLQISLFDVSDLTKPKRVANYIQAGGDGSSSDAQYDHKAFRLLENGLLILPVQVQDWSSWQMMDTTIAVVDDATTSTSPIRRPDQSFDGFKVYNVDQVANTITEYYEISHGSNYYNGCWGFSYLSPRSFVFGGDVWTLKTHTILIHDLTDRVQVGAAGGINLDQDLDQKVCTPYYWFDGPMIQPRLDDTSDTTETDIMPTADGDSGNEDDTSVSTNTTVITDVPIDDGGDDDTSVTDTSP